MSNYFTLTFVSTCLHTTILLQLIQLWKRPSIPLFCIVAFGRETLSSLTPSVCLNWVIFCFSCSFLDSFILVLRIIQLRDVSLVFKMVFVSLVELKEVALSTHEQLTSKHVVKKQISNVFFRGCVWSIPRCVFWLKFFCWN